MSCRKLNVLKTRSPHGSVAWGGMVWKLYLEVLPPCCGAIHSQACVWGACCCWPMVAAEDPSSLSEWTADRYSSPTRNCVWIKISWLPCMARAKVDLSSLEAVPDVWRKEEEMGWRSVTQVHHKLQEKIVFKLSDAGVDPGTFGLHNILNNWNIVSNMTFFTFFCKACRKWLTWVFYSLWDRPRCTLKSVNAPSELNVSSLFSLLCTWDSRWVLVSIFESISATYLLSSMERYKRI